MNSFQTVSLPYPIKSIIQESRQNPVGFLAFKEELMTNEELNTALYRKMYNEQAAFREQLLGMTPEEILSHAYEYVQREDILLSLEYRSLPDKQCRALLKSDTPLADVFAAWEKWETNHMDQIWAVLEAQANRMAREEFLQHREER